MGCFIWSCFFVSPAALAKGPELEFKAAIAEVNQPAEGVSTVIVSLFSESTDFDITVIVDENTKIESYGSEIELSELEIGDYIKVCAFFSDAGIVAEEIDLLDGRLGQFRLRGLIDGVSSSCIDRRLICSEFRFWSVLQLGYGIIVGTRLARLVL